MLRPYGRCWTIQIFQLVMALTLTAWKTLQKEQRLLAYLLMYSTICIMLKVTIVITAVVSCITIWQNPVATAFLTDCFSMFTCVDITAQCREDYMLASVFSHIKVTDPAILQPAHTHIVSIELLPDRSSNPTQMGSTHFLPCSLQSDSHETVDSEDYNVGSTCNVKYLPKCVQYGISLINYYYLQHKQ